MGSTDRYVKPSIAARNVVLSRLKGLRVKMEPAPDSMLTSPGNSKQTVIQFKKT